MKVALASPPFPKSINDGLAIIERLVKDAVKQHAEIICFPNRSYRATPFQIIR
jgi:predicted amidohydrolase